MSYEFPIRSSQAVLGSWELPSRVQDSRVHRKRVLQRSMPIQNIGFKLDLSKDFQREASLFGIRQFGLVKERLRELLVHRRFLGLPMEMKEPWMMKRMNAVAVQGQ